MFYKMGNTWTYASKNHKVIWYSFRPLIQMAEKLKEKNLMLFVRSKCQTKLSSQHHMFNITKTTNNGSDVGIMGLENTFDGNVANFKVIKIWQQWEYIKQLENKFIDSVVIYEVQGEGFKNNRELVKKDNGYLKICHKSKMLESTEDHGLE